MNGETSKVSNLRAAHGEGSRKPKSPSSNGSPKIIGLAPQRLYCCLLKVRQRMQLMGSEIGQKVISLSILAENRA